MRNRHSEPIVWSIILAGGNGERTRPFIQRCFGHSLPKQYCTFAGTRSMLEHTWERADRLSRPDRKITVMARDHHAAWKALKKPPDGKILFQPYNRDTAAGVFLPLSYVRAWNPEATVVVFPSDHFIYPEEQFVIQVQRAVKATDRMDDRLILLGLAPTHAESEYGWIVPGDILPCRGVGPIRTVRAFLEKPDRITADKAMARGGLWNTMILTGKVRTLWNMGWRCVPDLMRRFDRLSKAVDSPQEGGTLQQIYQDMPHRNFSADLLQRIPDHIGVLELQDVLWSDWGNPKRILETLYKIGKKPSFNMPDGIPTRLGRIAEDQFVEVN